jgi:hypothetical protein
MGDGTGIIYKKLSCTTGTGCDPSKVPDRVDTTSFSFTDYCGTPMVADIVQWSSRVSKGESFEQALANTIADGKISSIITYEKRCVSDKRYYIGGEPASPGWMCAGDKYRLNPNSSSTQWQLWYNGAWTSNFDWNSAMTCQNFVSPCNNQQCGGSDGKGGTCGCSSGKMCISGQCQTIGM